MTKATRCLEALVAMALTLGARPLAAEEVLIRDDFVEDPVWDDGEPLTWALASCCPARAEARPGEGVCLTATSDNIGGLASQQVFQGDVSVRMRVRLPPGTGGEGHGIAISLHFDPFGVSGYHAAIRQDRSALLIRFDSGNLGFRFDQLAAIDFDPTAQDAIVELRSVGPAVQFRAWAADGEEAPPLNPLLSANDTKYRAGSVMMSVGWLLPAACVRWAEVTLAPSAPPFRRGDADGSGALDISDGVFGLNFLFLGGPSPSCLDAFDTDDSGELSINDGIGIFNFLFLGGAAPAEPFAACGADPTDDALSCAESPACP